MFGAATSFTVPASPVLGFASSRSSRPSTFGRRPGCTVPSTFGRRPGCTVQAPEGMLRAAACPGAVRWSRSGFRRGIGLLCDPELLDVQGDGDGLRANLESAIAAPTGALACQDCGRAGRGGALRETAMVV